MTLPGVPTKSVNTEDRLRAVERLLSELRQGGYGRTTPFDNAGNTLWAPDTAGAGWGMSRPRTPAALYPVSPDRGTAGYTWTVALAAVITPVSQKILVGTRYSHTENVATGTSVGEYEVRWNPGSNVLARGDSFTLNSLLMDSWDSGTPGTKGQDGTLVRETEYVWPQDGLSAPVVGYETSRVTVSIWAKTKDATGDVADIAKVTPGWIYQAGYGLD